MVVDKKLCFHDFFSLFIFGLVCLDVVVNSSSNAFFCFAAFSFVLLFSFFFFLFSYPFLSDSNIYTSTAESRYYMLLVNLEKS